MAPTLADVPTAPGRFLVLGHLKPLLLTPLPFVRSLRRHGGMVRVYFGNRPVYFLTTPGLLRELLVGHGSDFDKGSIFDQGKAFVGEGLITSAGQLHRQQRRLIQPAFSASAVERYIPAMRESALREISRWQDGRPVEILEAMMRVAFGAITAVIFSGDMDPTAEQRLLRHLRLLIRGAMVRALAPRALARVPIRLNRGYPAAVLAVRGIIDQTLAAAQLAGGRRPDLVQALQATGMDQQQLKDELVSIMIAGTETTGGAMAWVLYEIAHRPEVGRRVQEEVDRIVADGPITSGDLTQLEYTQRLLSEVLRSRSVWLSTRRALRPVELDGIPVPVGTELAFSLYAIHHDPDLFPRPDEFDVDRWLPEVARRLPRGSFIPFLDGNRKCLGDSFAWLEMLTVVATIAARWNLRLPPRSRVREVPVATIRPSNLRMVPVARR
jgi:cytochrome P450